MSMHKHLAELEKNKALFERKPAASASHFQLDGDNDLKNAAHSSKILKEIAKIAQFWNAEIGQNRSHSKDRHDAMTVESLIAISKEMGVELTVEERDISTLGEGNFPVILLKKNYESLIIIQRQKNNFLTLKDNKEQWLGVETLQAHQSGVLFFVKPLPFKEAEAAERILPRQSDKNQETLSNASILDQTIKLTFTNQKPLMLQLIVVAILSNFFMMALPLYSMVVYDRVVPHGAYETLWALSLGIFALLIADFILRYVRLKLQDAISLKATHSQLSHLYRTLLQAKMENAPRTSGGLTNAMRDIDQLNHVVPLLFVALLVDIPFFALILILMASLGGWVAVPPIVGFLALIAFQGYSHKKGLQSSQEVNQLMSYQSNILVETVESLESTKTTASQGRLLRRWEQATDAQGFSGHTSKLWAGMSAQSTLFLSQFINVAVIIVGVYGIGTGSVTVGSLIACSLLVGRAIGPAGQVVYFYFRVKHLLTILKPFENFVNQASEQAGDKSQPFSVPTNWTILVKNADFKYADEQKMALSNLNLTINEGEKVGIVGKSGSGKSTFLRLIPRLQETSAGNFLIGGRDIRQYNPRNLREHIGFMRQDTMLFDDSLRTNITFGLDHIDEAAFERAVTLSGVKDFASSHPQGYGYRVGPRGEKLSGGERQAILLARSIICNPKILILDEPTASMDSTLESTIIRNLKHSLPGTTLIMATHRAPVLELVDRIIWFDQGKIIADGPRSDVLGKLSQKAA